MRIWRLFLFLGLLLPILTQASEVAVCQGDFYAFRFIFENGKCYHQLKVTKDIPDLSNKKTLFTKKSFFILLSNHYCHEQVFLLLKIQPP